MVANGDNVVLLNGCQWRLLVLFSFARWLPMATMLFAKRLPMATIGIFLNGWSVHAKTVKPFACYRHQAPQIHLPIVVVPILEGF